MVNKYLQCFLKMHKKFRIVCSRIFVQGGTFTKVNITFETIHNYSTNRYSVSGQTIKNEEVFEANRLFEIFS